LHAQGGVRTETEPAHALGVVLHAQGGVRMRNACMYGACAIDEAHTLLAPPSCATTSTSDRARAYTVFRASDCDHACMQIMQLAWSVEHTHAMQREAVLITSVLVDHHHHPDGAFHATPHRAAGHGSHCAGVPRCYGLVACIAGCVHLHGTLCTPAHSYIPRPRTCSGFAHVTCSTPPCTPNDLIALPNVLIDG
jgi:hypothetical protein